MTTIVEVQATPIEGGTSFTCVSPITLRPIVAPQVLSEQELEAPAFTVQDFQEFLERESRKLSSPAT